MNIDKIINILLIMAVSYLLFFKKEKMTTDNTTKQLIMDHYKIDVDAIRNLSKLANDLTKTGKLKVPGGLEIDGKLTVKGESILEKKVNVNSELAIKSTADVITHFNRDNSGKHYINGSTLEVNSVSTFNGSTNFKNQKHNTMTHLNHPNGNIYLNGNVIMDGHNGSGKNLHVHGNANFGVIDGQAKVVIDTPGNSGRISTYGANKKPNVFIQRAHDGGSILVHNDITNQWVSGMESHNWGGHIFVNHKDGKHRIHLNGIGDRSEINFAPDKIALLQAHKQRLAIRSHHTAHFNNSINDDDYRIRYLHHDCPLTARGEGHKRKTSC